MQKYIIYGTGKVAKEHYEHIATIYGEEAVECFLDSMLSKESFCGKPVMHPNRLKEIQCNHYKYLLGTLTNRKSMLTELIKQGVYKENIEITEDYGSNSFEENVNEVKKVLIYPEILNHTILQSLEDEFKLVVPNMDQLDEQPTVIIREKNISSSIFSIKKKAVFADYDLILVWDKTHLEDKDLNDGKHIYCIDPSYFFIIDVRILLRLNYILESKEKKAYYRNESQKNYMELYKSYNGMNSYVFGCGPSCEAGTKKKFANNSVRIVCNNLIDNVDLIKKIKPNIYVLIDEYLASQGFINMIEKINTYIIENDCVLIVPELLGAVLIRRYPMLDKKLIRMSLDAKDIQFPSPKDMSVFRKAYNVITTLALPVASFISSKIYIFGCDGVADSEEIVNGNVWKHNEKLEKDKSFDNYATGDDVEWEKEYYLKHISYFEELLEYGEGLGKEYISYTKSYIPALQKRHLKHETTL